MNENSESSVSLKKTDVQVSPYPAYSAPRTPLRPPCTYTAADRFFALAALLLGFLCVKTYVVSSDATGLGLMASISAAAVSVFNFVYCRALGMRGSKTTTALFIIELILSPSFFVCDNAAVTVICAAMIFAANAYFSYASYSEGSRSVVNNAFRSVLMSPFYEFGSSFGALFQKRRSTGGRQDIKKALPVILGLLLSVPLCVVVGILLGAADEQFAAFFSITASDLISWIEDHLLVNILLFGVSLPVGMYIFSAAYSRSYKMRNEGALKKLPATDTRVLPASMCAAFLVPLTLLYFMFTAMQAMRLISSSYASQSGFSYAEYARAGFFQLCAVTVINLAVIAAVTFFSKREKRETPKLLRAFIIVFSLLTHCLIVTALIKMLMYIDNYGMTPKRVQTSIFMAWLFVMFALLIAKQFIPKLSVTKLGCCLAALVIALMAFVPVDALIARYNISHYISGDIPWMGVSAMYELDASAAAEFAKIDAPYLDPLSVSKRTFFKHYEYLEREFSEMNAWDLNLQRMRALEAMKKY